MSQVLSQHLSQQMRMEQRLTPQLIQSMAVLQKPVADLETYISEALESNAALELAEPEAPRSAEDDSKEGGRGPGEDQARQQSPSPGRGEIDGEFARLDRYSRAFQDGDLEWADRTRSHRKRSFGDDERDSKQAALANTAGRDGGLQEHLLGQWALSEFDPEVRRAGEVIINHLDGDGYLRNRMEELVDRVRPSVSLETMQSALREVQKLEPAGVAARDLVECLLLQVDALPGDNTIERKLIAHHLDDIAENRLPLIAKGTGYSLGEINEAIKVIRTTLYPQPGYLVGERSAPPIRPDVLVEYAQTGGGLIVRLARGNAPNLRIRDDMAGLAKARTNGTGVREFAKKQVDEATALIEAVQFRQNRLLEVARAIAERQREFFDVGPQGLKVFRMSDLAAELGCDPSTISRTVAEKYMQTPRGIHPLRYFFTGGTENECGESVGWDRVKQRVKEIVDVEDRKDPLSDDQIASLLRNEGIDISRRTVAKYRGQLNIPSARQRKAF